MLYLSVLKQRLLGISHGSALLRVGPDFLPDTLSLWFEMLGCGLACGCEIAPPPAPLFTFAAVKYL